MIKKYASMDGVSGREQQIAEEFRRDLAKFCDETEINTMGTVIGTINPGQKTSIMIAAHMDEVGIMVRYINPKGYIYFIPIGGLSADTIMDQEIRFPNEVFGTIGSTPPHLRATTTTPKIEDLWIDVGAESKEEVKEMGIKVGTVGTINSEYRDLGKYVMGKALDDRIGMTAMLEALEMLDHPDATIYIVGSVKEEVGLVGVRSAVVAKDPTYAIAIDVTMAGDNPGIPIMKAPVECGKGPVIAITDGGGRGIISSEKFNDMIVDMAEEFEIPYQLEVAQGGTTDATMMQLIGEGRHATVLSVATRYIHSPRTLMHKDDYKSLVELLSKIMNWVK